jgi:DNA-binding NtrC family response regulator
MGSLMGVSVPMQRVYSAIQRASFHRYPVLILGEAGTGKELVARSIHSANHSSGSRPDKPFVPFDCKALAPPLMEPELFGYARDAFIGTPEAKKGLVQLAEDGTLLLREIAALPLKLQTKLFHAMREQEFSPVGSTERFAFRARIMATTQRNLAELVAKGTFREDLYFHLSAVRIELPPLHARRPDIPLLASYFLEKHSEQGHPVRSISDAAMECLLAYSWPGNVLELERAIQWALSFASSAVVETDDLPPVVRVAASRRLRDPAARLSTMQPEYLAIIKALDATGGDRAAAAELLHIAKSALDTKLQNYGL